MRKYMSQLITEFLNGNDYGLAATARFIGNKFYSYNTVICARVGDVYYLTLDKYSKTTTTQQKALRESLPPSKLVIVSADSLQEIARTV